MHVSVNWSRTEVRSRKLFQCRREPPFQSDFREQERFSFTPSAYPRGSCVVSILPASSGFRPTDIRELCSGFVDTSGLRTINRQAHLTGMPTRTKPLGGGRYALAVNCAGNSIE